MPKYEENNGIKFINPYNFVSINDKSNRDCSSTKNVNNRVGQDELHTGVLHCMLTVKSPLVIPGDIKTKIDLAPDEKDNKRKKYHYEYATHKMGNDVIIPGSSIRGMLRSVYEASTNSCMSTINEKEHITKRSDIGTFAPCVLKKERVDDSKYEWRLYEAIRIPLVGDGKNYKELQGDQYVRFEVKTLETGEKYIKTCNDEKIYYGQEVEITENDIGHEKKYYDKNGNIKYRDVWNGKTVKNILKKMNTNSYLYIGEAISNKHAESVFKVSKESHYNISGDMINMAIEMLEDTILMYRNEGVNRNISSSKPTEKHYGYKGYERAKENGIIPLWYKVDNDGRLYLSMAAIGRIAFHKSLNELVNGHEPCMRRNELCPACSIFGMISENDNNSISSKVRITDAVGIGEIKTTPNITLKELGTPRSSYLPFYSEEGKGYDDKDARIRGRKFYWHIPAVNDNPSIYSTDEKTNRNASFELINVGNIFEFDIYYELLSQEQLDMLMWTIELQEEKKGIAYLAHKLGHGKPLGLGSICINIMSCNEREYTDDYAVVAKTFNIKETELSLLHKSSWMQLKNLLEFNSEDKEEIRYPYITISHGVHKVIEDKKKSGLELKENVVANHKWFSNNKTRLPQNKEGLSVIELKEVQEPIGLRKLGDFQSIKKRDNSSKKLNNNDTEKRELKKGCIKALKNEFGFIKGQNSEMVFFHRSSLKDCKFNELKEGDLVEYFDKKKSDNKRTATVVTLLQH